MGILVKLNVTVTKRGLTEIAERNNLDFYHLSQLDQKEIKTARHEWCCWKDFSFSHASIQSVGIKTLKFVVTPLKTCFQGCMLEVQCVQNHRSFSRAKQPLNTIQVGQFERD
jgi:hypothetical protein